MSTGISSLTAPADHTTTAQRLAAMVELTKPRIVLMELVAVVATLHIATGYGPAGSRWSAALALAVAVGTALVAGSANAMNQWIEQERDRLMRRTRDRPIPSGRLASGDALAFGLLTLVLGASTLGMFAGPAPTLIAILTWAAYVAVYTPLKSRSWTNTAVGAVTGAAPLWIGWTAGGGAVTDPLALVLFAVMYIWQFPHFMAIAWLCRDDYAAAGYRMSTTHDRSGLWAGLQAVVGSALLLPATLAPLVLSDRVSWAVYAAPALAIGVLMMAASARFLARRDDATARRLLRASLVFVPAWLLALWCSGV